MRTIDWRAYTYCDHCDTSIDFYKTDMESFNESRNNVDNYISTILKKSIKVEAVSIKDVIMSECTIFKTIEVLREFAQQLQEGGKDPTIDQSMSQTYIVSDTKCALDLIIDGKVWYTMITGAGWSHNNIVKTVEKDEKSSFIDNALSIIGLGKR